MKPDTLLSCFSEDLIKKINIIEQTSLNEYQAIVDAFAKQKDLSATPARKELESIISKHHITMKKILDIMNVSLTLLQEIKREKIDVPEITKSLISKNIIKASSEEKFVEKIKYLNDKVFLVLSSKIDEEKAIAKVFPLLNYCSIKCSVVVVMETKTEGDKPDPQNYKPKIDKEIPVAVVQIDIDNFGEKTRHSFSLTKEELDDIIRKLQIAKIQLNFIFPDHRRKD